MLKQNESKATHNEQTQHQENHLTSAAYIILQNWWKILTDSL